MLAKAGVGRLLLLDDDVLKWENIGRHLLGADRVGKSKSKALAEFLRRQLPHLEATPEPLTWEEFYEKLPAELEQCDAPNGDIAPLRQRYGDLQQFMGTLGSIGCSRPANLQRCSPPMPPRPLPPCPPSPVGVGR